MKSEARVNPPTTSVSGSASQHNILERHPLRHQDNLTTTSRPKYQHFLTRTETPLLEGAKSPESQDTDGRIIGGELKRERESEEIDPDPTTKRQKKSAPKSEPTQRETPASDWLNSLNDHEAMEIHKKFNLANSHQAVLRIDDKVAARLKNCVGVNGQEDGSYWVNWATCMISNLRPENAKDGRNWHPRFKISVPKPGSKKKIPYYSILEESVSAQHLKTFGSLATPSGNDGSSQARLHSHHIAFNSDRQRALYQPMHIYGSPGPNISHLCDNTGCVEVEHLEYALDHAANMKRQNCLGVCITVNGNRILGAQPCKHATGFDGGEWTEEVLETCCRRLYVVCIGVQWPEVLATYQASVR
jgi:hypothetical protein